MAVKQSTRSKAPAASTAEVIDVAPVDQDVSTALEAGSQVTAFLAGVRQFFARANQLEAAALATRDYARSLPFATSAADDEIAQQLVVTSNANRRTIVEHFGVTSVLHNLHKRVVARREKGVALLEEAAMLGNTIHNKWVSDENRRVAAEQDAKRREAEQRAREDRERVLAELEAAAVAREEEAGDLSDREQSFVNYHVAGGFQGNATRQAEAAGFKDGMKSAARLLSLPKIQKAIKAKLDAAAIREQATARKEAPLYVDDVPEVKPNISRAAGTHDRTTWGGEVLDGEATIEAFRQGKHGIPGDLFMINPAKLNEYGRALHERLDLWPGVRHTKKTGVV